MTTSDVRAPAPPLRGDHDQRLFIGGAWTSTTTGATDEVLNPATGEVIDVVGRGGAADAVAAVTAARAAFDHGPWTGLEVAERVEVLRRFADAIEARAATFADLAVREAGATRALAERLHVGLALVHARRTWDIATGTWSQPVALGPFLTPSAAGTVVGHQIVLREPIGVVAAITPFNVPTFVNLAKVSAALVAGNAVVLKPSPYTPLSALALAECALEAGLPPGVLNIITGGPDVGEVLTNAAEVDMVSFTGSTSVGARVMAQAAPTIKRVHLELGGKSALIVRVDADVAGAARFGLGQITTQAGQACAVCTRHLVHADLVDDYIAAISEAAAKVRLGDPADPQTEMGPLIRAVQRDAVAAMVDTAVAQGASVAAGGRIPDGSLELDRGFFYPPTVLTGVDSTWPIAQDEVFGPVAVVIPFTDDDDAVRIANDSRYGLSGAVWSADAGAAYGVARRVRTGQLGINGGAGTTPPDGPFGGYKQSGLGRERGTWGLDEYTEVKTVSFHAD